MTTINDDAIQAIVAKMAAGIVDLKDLGTLMVAMLAMRTDMADLKKTVHDLKEEVKADIGELNRSVGDVKDDVSHLKYDVERMDRRVKAIELVPPPYGRPKAYHGAVAVHSVSGTRVVSRTRV